MLSQGLRNFHCFLKNEFFYPKKLYLKYIRWYSEDFSSDYIQKRKCLDICDKLIWAFHFCVCLKRLMLYDCLFLLPLLWRNFSGISRNLEQKNDLQTIKQLHNSVICFYKTKFFWSILLLKKSQQKEISQWLLDRCSHLFPCISLKYTLSSGQNK